MPRPVKSDVNYNGVVSPVASNRLIVTANNDGEVCFYTSEPVAIIVDLFAVTDGIQAIPNQRTDTREPVRTDSGLSADCTLVPVTTDDGITSLVVYCDAPRRPAGSTLRINVPESVGGNTVVGQLTVAQTTGPGFVTAYGCDDGIPRGADGQINKSDLNYDGRINPVASNRLIVTADNDGDVCFYTLDTAHLVVDINGIADADVITPFDNQRTDTRPSAGTGCSKEPWYDAAGNLLGALLVCDGVKVSAGSLRRIKVPEAVGGKTVVGQLTMAQAEAAGFFTAFGCLDGIPEDSTGNISKSDLNFTSATPVSNRLIAKADVLGQICIWTLSASHMVVDVNGIFDSIDAFPNQRTDTRGTPQPAVSPSQVDVQCGIQTGVGPEQGVARWVRATVSGLAPGTDTRLDVWSDESYSSVGDIIAFQGRASPDGRLQTGGGTRIYPAGSEASLTTLSGGIQVTTFDPRVVSRFPFSVTCPFRPPPS